jgi:hypothetical protein
MVFGGSLAVRTVILVNVLGNLESGPGLHFRTYCDSSTRVLSGGWSLSRPVVAARCLQLLKWRLSSESSVYVILSAGQPP